MTVCRGLCAADTPVRVNVGVTPPDQVIPPDEVAPLIRPFLADRVGSSIAMQEHGTGDRPLLLDDLRHLEECSVGLRRILQGFFPRQAGCYAVFAHWRSRGRIHTAGTLRHRLDVAGVELIELIDVAEDGIQIAHHSRALFLSEFEVGQRRHVPDVFVFDLQRIIKDAPNSSSPAPRTRCAAPSPWRPD